MSIGPQKRLDRFYARVQRGDNCWEWTGQRIHNGYGVVGWMGKTTPAHRVSFELTYGPIPGGLTLDHKCRNRACVRPDHLEAVTMKENILRGDGFAAQNARKTACPKGHALDGLKQSSGERYCKTCHVERCRRYRRNLPLAGARRGKK